LVVPPIRTAGFVGNTYRTRQFGEEPRNHADQVEVFVNSNSYVWQPWFITVAADMNLAFEVERGGTAGNANARRAAGGAGLGILPFSRYPSSIRYRRTDNRIDGDFSGSDFISDLVEATARAAFSSDLQASASATAESIRQPDFGDEERRQARFGVIKTFSTDRAALNLVYDEEDFASETEKDQERRLAVGTLSYDSRPFEEVTSQSVTTAIYETDDSETTTLERQSVQGISTAQWHPAGRPFNVNAALRTLTEDIKTNDVASSSQTTKTKTQLANGTIGLNYPIRPQLTFNAGANARAERVETDAGSLQGELPRGDETTLGGGLLANLNWLSETRPVLGFDWRWRAAGGANVEAETAEGLTDSENVIVGHAADRTFEAGFLTPLRLGVSQDVSVVRNSVDGATPSIFHNISIGHSSSRSGTVTFARLSINDRRELSDDRDEAQLGQFQLNRQEALDLDNNWVADLSIQASRQKSAGEEPETSLSANGTIGYFARDTFGVRNLRFSSQLTLSAIGLEDVISREDSRTQRSDFFRSDWRNKLEYTIGRLIASIEATLFHNQNQFGNFVIFRVRREFGGDTQ